MWTKGKAMSASFTLVAVVFMLVVFLVPSNALAGSGKIPPGQLKKMDANQLEYYLWWDNNDIGNKLKPYGQVKKTEMFRMQRGYALNPKFSYLQGYVQEVKSGNQTLIYISESNKKDADEAVIRITGGTAIFVNGKDAYLADIDENDSIVAVVNPAGIAFVVSVLSDGKTWPDNNRGVPEIVKLTPADEAKDVKIGLKKLVATFDENIYGLEKENDIESAIRIKNVTKNKMIIVSDINVEGRELQIYLSSGLDEDCKYSVYVPSELFEDSDDNEFGGIAWGDWIFTTAKENDNDVPEIVKLTPADGAKDVKVGLKKLVATFDENIYGLEKENDIESAIRVKNVTKNKTITVSDIDVDGRELHIYLSSGLDEDCKYSVYIPPGLFEDNGDNEFAGIARGDWEFTTDEVNDDDAPVVDKLVPGNGARVSDIKQLYIDFNENIRWVDTDLKNQVFVFKMGSNDLIVPKSIVIDDNRLLLTFNSNLGKGEYGVAITSGVIEDLYGNDFSGISINKWRFEVI